MIRYGFWDDEAAATSFATSHPLSEPFAGGFRATLQPLRAFGAWPGLPDDLSRARHTAEGAGGPVAVITLGTLRWSQGVRFLRASRPAEKSAQTSDGLLWGTASTWPPFVATFTLWRDADAAIEFAYGVDRPGHNDAIVAQRRKDFHHASAFVRFAPIDVTGSLGNRNPLAADKVA